MDFIEKYFNAEKAESLVFFCIGLLAAGVAVWAFWFQNSAVWRGAGWPIALVAAIQIAVGANIFFRSSADLARVREQFEQPEKPLVKTAEIPRMVQVMRQFEILRWSEIALIVVGLGLFFWKKGSENEWLMGLGAGLAVQAAIMLVADFFAEKRGHEYLAALKNAF